MSELGKGIGRLQMSQKTKRLAAGITPGGNVPIQNALPSPISEGIRLIDGAPTEKRLVLSALEMALYRLTCTVNIRTTPIQDAVVALMKELGAEEAAIHLRTYGEGSSLEHYMTVRKEGGSFHVSAFGMAPGELAQNAFSGRWMTFAIPKKRRKHGKSTLFRFNMIPGDTTYSVSTIKNGHLQTCAVPLFMTEKTGKDGNGVGAMKDIVVLTLKGRRLAVQESRQTGTPAVTKAALLVACGARLLSRMVDARFDALTGLQKRPEFEAQLRGMMADYLRGGPNFSLMMFDLDRFKRINDEFGHEAGDFALRAVARALSRGMRSIRYSDVQERRATHNSELDLIFRYGGEELTAVLPATGRDEALIIAERLRESIKDIRLDVDGREVRLSVSAGVGDADTHVGRGDTKHMNPDDEASSMTREVDIAMYLAKRSGRDRVAYTTDSPDENEKFKVHFAQQKTF